MRRIGLIGGMSWESTVPYYRTINQVVAQELGGYHSAEMLLYSVDFAKVHELQHADRWDEAGRYLGQAAAALAAGGADFLVLATNTMHKVAAHVEAASRLPLLHIADATADAVKASGLRSVGLLGTRFTMEEPFLIHRLEERGLAVQVPDEEDRQLVNRVIFEELVKGEVLDASRDAYRAVISRLVNGGAEGVILGCTEIGILVSERDSPVPVFDTTAIHARAAAMHALG